MSEIEYQTKYKSEVTTKGIYFGLPEAENESPETRGLDSFYEDVHGLMDMLKNETFIITGRKGCGKTAFVNYLKRISKDNTNIHCCEFYPKDYDLEKLILKIDEKEEKKYKLLYEWIILVRFTELILNANKSFCADAIKELNEFWNHNSGHLKIGKMLLESQDVESNVNGGFSFRSLWNLFLSKVTKRKYVRPKYTQLIDDLRKRVKQALEYPLHKGHTFYMLFDNLDEDFDVNRDDDCKKILCLLDVAKQFNNEFIDSTRGKVVVMLRDDLLDKMSGLSTSFTKTIMSCSFQLKWFDPSNDNSNEQNLFLRRLINKRLSLNFEKLDIEYNINDAWSSFVDNSNQVGYNYKSAFMYILGFTQCRPRDFMYIFQNVGNCDYQMPLDEVSIKKLLRNYVNIAFSEASDELVGVLENRERIKSLLQIFSEFSDMNEITFRVLSNRLKKYKFNEVDKYLRILVDYNIIIPVVNDEEKPHYLYPNLKGQLKNYKYHLPLWLKAYFDENVII